jgi:hypothetical protein
MLKQIKCAEMVGRTVKAIGGGGFHEDLVVISFEDGTFALLEPVYCDGSCCIEFDAPNHGDLRYEINWSVLEETGIATAEELAEWRLEADRETENAERRELARLMDKYGTVVP